MNAINRRQFIQYSTAASATALALTMTPTKLMADIGTLNNGLPYVSTRTHLLNRTSFGVNTELKAKYDELGYEGFVDYQLGADSIDDSEIEDYIAENLITVNMPLTEIRDLIDSEQIGQFQAAEELKAATFLRAVYSKKQLHQVMVEFWSNHFNVFHFDGPLPILKTKEDRDVMRPFALSSFSEILHADAKSTAMIYYLDTFSSTKEAPNENYARELMELHTLGVDGPYGHHDIDEVARCFTGWGINQATGEFRFYQESHDFDEKTVLGKIIAADGGVTDGEQVIDILAEDISTANFISTKLCRHFIADNPSQDIINSTTDLFIQSSGDIKQCLKHILMSKHFQFAQDMKLKRPFSYMTSAVRTLDGDIKNNQFNRVTRLFLGALGQQSFNWSTPDGYPDKADYWESTTGMLYRWDFSNLLAFDALEGYSYDANAIISEPHSPENVVSQISDKILHRPMNNTDADFLLQYLNDGASNNTATDVKILGAIAIALSSPYFQLS